MSGSGVTHLCIKSRCIQKWWTPKAPQNHALLGSPQGLVWPGLLTATDCGGYLKDKLCLILDFLGFGAYLYPVANAERLEMGDTATGSRGMTRVVHSELHCTADAGYAVDQFGSLRLRSVIHLWSCHSFFGTRGVPVLLSTCGFPVVGKGRASSCSRCCSSFANAWKRRSQLGLTFGQSPTEPAELGSFKSLVWWWKRCKHDLLGRKLL